ncbi:hypothetical protein DFH09DRAFT_1315759 [Mycena vulgaris]|nr:hypothetical protein DFH09DRAFT_1315759 [Mycena vulgaris]
MPIPATSSLRLPTPILLPRSSHLECTFHAPRAPYAAHPALRAAAKETRLDGLRPQSSTPSSLLAGDLPLDAACARRWMVDDRRDLRVHKPTSSPRRMAVDGRRPGRPEGARVDFPLASASPPLDEPKTGVIGSRRRTRLRIRGYVFPFLPRGRVLTPAFLGAGARRAGFRTEKGERALAIQGTGQARCVVRRARVSADALWLSTALDLFARGRTQVLSSLLAAALVIGIPSSGFRRAGDD